MKVFKEGDLVWVYISKVRYPTSVYNKLKARKIGPCKILRKINDNAYEVELLEGWNISNSFNVFDLYEYIVLNDDSQESNKSKKEKKLMDL